MGLIKCAKCGAEVERTGSRQRYCPSCAYKLLQERQKARRHRPATTTTKVIHCVVCGEEVKVSSRGGRAKYCEYCAGMAYSAARSRSNAKRREKAHGVCCVCGEEFDYISINGYERKCCDGCRTRGKLKDRGVVLKPRRDSKPKHASTLAEMIAAAKAAGMSYGQYKAQMKKA